MTSSKAAFAFNQEFSKNMNSSLMPSLEHVPPLPKKEKEERLQKYIADERIRCEQFKKEHPPPTIALELFFQMVRTCFCANGHAIIAHMILIVLLKIFEQIDLITRYDLLKNLRETKD